MLEVLQFEELFLERGDDCIFVCRFSVIKHASGGKISVHLLYEVFQIENNDIQNSIAKRYKLRI